MKKYFIYTILIAFVATLSFTSCKEDETPTPEGASAYETMTTYMTQNSMDLPDVLDGWITARPADIADLPAFLDTYDIFDLRSPEVFGAGHIDGAVNVTYANLLEKAATTSKPILMVCYTGQSAGHATVALRLSNYSAKVLKWGMSGWDSALSAPWLGNSGTDNGVVGVGHANWSTDATEAVSDFDASSISSTSTDGASILAERVAAMLSGGFKGTASATVLDNPAGYQINNYWGQTDVDHYGHIASAYRVNPLSIANGEIANLDPAKAVCTYCWTGQTSSMITAYLTVLGFNATSLKFGANSMIYSELEAHKFVAPTVDFPTVQ